MPKNSKSAYVVPTLGSCLYLISSESQIKELSEAPETQLSLHSIANDVCKPSPSCWEMADVRLDVPA